MTKDLAVVGWIMVASALALLLALLGQAVRVAAIRRPGGAVACCLRQGGDTRWHTGFAAYRADRLCWFRSRGVRLRPDAVFDRQLFRPVERAAPGARQTRGEPERREPERRAPEGGPQATGRPGTAVVQFDTGAPGETLWMAIHSDALTGMLSWLEAAPRRWPVG